MHNICHFEKGTLPILSRLPSSVTFPPKADNDESNRSSALPCRFILRGERSKYGNSHGFCPKGQPAVSTAGKQVWGSSGGEVVLCRRPSHLAEPVPGERSRWLRPTRRNLDRNGLPGQQARWFEDKSCTPMIIWHGKVRNTCWRNQQQNVKKLLHVNYWEAYFALVNLSHKRFNNIYI